MRIRVGSELRFEFPQATPMIVMLNVHFSRFSDLEAPDSLMASPSVPIEGYRDSFGNWCSRLVAPAGHFTLDNNAVIRDSGVPSAHGGAVLGAPAGHFTLDNNAVIRDSGVPDPMAFDAVQHQVQHLPA